MKNLKDKIIFLTLELIEGKERIEKEEIRSLLKEFAKPYNVPIKGLPIKARNQKDIKRKHSDKKVYNNEIYLRLKDFIINNLGYKNTIQNLYNSI